MLGWSSSEWDVQGGDLDEVLDWARDAPGRTGLADRVTVAVLHDLPDGRGRAQSGCSGTIRRWIPRDVLPS